MLIFNVVNTEYFAYYNISTHTFRSYIQLLPGEKFNPFDKYIVKQWNDYFDVESNAYFLQGPNKFTLDVNLDIFKDFIDKVIKNIVNNDETLDRIIDFYKTKAYDINRYDYIDYFLMAKEDVIESVHDLENQFRKFRRRKAIEEL